MKPPPFALGDRVQESAWYPRVQEPRRTLTRLGTVVGFGRQPFIVRVMRDGTHTVASFHIRFWEKCH